MCSCVYLGHMSLFSLSVLFFSLLMFLSLFCFPFLPLIVYYKCDFHAQAHTVHAHTHIHTGTRERAVLNAYMSAGATRGIAKACKANQLGCTCEASLTSFVGEETYLHSCGEDVAFAIKFLKGFLTSIAGFSTFCSNCSSFSNAIVPTLSTSPIPTPGPTLSTSQCGPNCCKLAIDVHNDRVGYEVRKK